MTKLVHLLFAATILSAASAQTGVTLEQCLTLAEKNSPALQAADGSLRASELARTELSTTALPQLKGVAGASYAPVPPPFGYDPAISNGGQVGGQIVLQQSIYDGGVRGLKSEQLWYDAERLTKERQRALRDLTFSVKQTFIEALRAEREQELQQQSVGQLADYLGLVQRLHTGGGASYTDVLKTELQLSTAYIALQKASEAVATAKYSLGEFTGTTIDSTVNLIGSLAWISLDSLGNDRDTIVSNNLDLTIAGLGIARSVLDVELTRRERFPEISFIADAGYLSSLENLRLPGQERLKSLGYSMGIGIEIPLFNWGAMGLRVEQRAIETNGLRFQMELLHRSVKSELQKTRLQNVKAKERLLLLRNNILKAEENWLLTKSKFAGGVTLSLEVLSAQQLLTDVKLSELQTLADIQILAAKWEQLTAQ